MSSARLSDTPIVLTGPFRSPVQMLAEQTYGGHVSVHDEAAAAKLGLAGAPIEGPTHFSQFEPLAASLWGDRWFSDGCISAHFQNMVIEGEQVQAKLTVDGPAVSCARIDACKADGTPVLTGTCSVADHDQTELSTRLAAAIARPPATLYVLDLLQVGHRGPSTDVGTMGFDDHLGNLYPFTLRQKLAAITESMTYFAPDALTPWGSPVVPFEMLSVLTSAFSTGSGFAARQPSVGLFIDLEVKMLAGPVFVGRPYRLQREIVALGASKRTESYWTRTTLFDGDVAVSEVLLHQGVFKESYPDYPGEG